MQVQHRFKPALLRGERIIDLQDDILSLSTPQGTEDWTLDLADVTHVAYAQVTVNKTTTRTLDLDTARGRYQLSQTTDAADTGPFARAYLDGILDVLTRLNQLRPELEITYGLRGRARMGMFIVGMLSLLAGLALPIAALGSGVSGDRLTAAILPSLLLLALGAVFGWGNRPWQRPPRIKLAQLMATFSATAHSAAPPSGSAGRDTPPPPKT